MGLERRLEFANSFRNARNGYMPDTDLWPPYPLKDIDPSHSDPALENLKLPEEKLRRERVLKTSEIHLACERAEETNSVLPLIRKAFGEIRQKTSTLAVYFELDELFKRDINGKKLTDFVPFQWGVPCIVNGERAKGIYYIDKPLIKIAEKQPRTRETLESVAQYGVLPPAIQTGMHEMTHAVQFNFGPSKKIPPELVEAQAYRTEQISLARKPHDTLVNDVATSKLYQHLDRRRFDSAVWIIDRFNALGLSQEEIVQRIHNSGEWDEKKGSWTGLEQKLAMDMKRRDLDEEGLEQTVMAYDLNRAIDRHTARIITQGVLREAFKGEIDKRRREDEKWSKGQSVTVYSRSRIPALSS